MRDIPQISIVIASHNAGAIIADCLAALRAQPERDLAEIIVADSSSAGVAELVRTHFPEVHMLGFSEPLTIPELRGQAIAAAHGDLIAILDPYCIVQDHWLTEALKVHAERPEPAIGGAVELDDADRQSLVHWAAYLSEYAAFMLPLQAGPTSELTGNNITYKRRALGDLEKLKQTGFWKTFFNWQLKADGHSLWTAPSLIVKLRKPIPFAEFFRSRYHHGRCFAAMRVTRVPAYQRWLRALTTPLLPVVALWRQARSLWPKRRYRSKFILAIPLLLLFSISWAWGELWGYLRGPGCSCTQLFY